MARTGTNPAKFSPQLNDNQPSWQVIIPVYIPQLDGYFEHMPEIVEMCLESLYLTSKGRATVAVISNGCVDSVNEQLRLYQKRGWIDQLIINRDNLGKIDAIIPTARSSHADLITFSDCDVLFLPGWLEATEAIFSAFPECGQVSPFPAPFLYSGALSTVLGGFLSGTLRVANVVSPEDLDSMREMLALGSEQAKDPNQAFRTAQFSLQRKDICAVIGAGHFVTTVRRQVIDYMPKELSFLAVGSGSESRYMDIPPERFGAWKLSTTKLYVYHMGNCITGDVNYKYTQIKRYPVTNKQRIELELPRFRRALIAYIPWKWRQWVMKLCFLTGIVKYPNL